MAKLSEGSVRTLENLEAWFKAPPLSPYFTIYNGTSVRDRLAVNLDIKDIDEAWSQLEGYLTPIEDGVFKIFKTHEPKNPNGMSIKYAPGSANVGTPSVSGLPNNSIMGISEYDNRIGSIIEKAVSVEKEKWEQNRKIEDLESMINAKQSIGDRVGAMIENSLPQLIDIVLPALVAKITGVTPQPGNIAGLQNNAAEPIHTDETDIINSALERIQAAGIDLVVVLPKLADMVEKNPTMIKGFLNSL